MNKTIRYTDEQRRQLDFLCKQAKKMEKTLDSLPYDSNEYAAQMRIYIAASKQIDSLRSAVESAQLFTDKLLEFAPAGDAR